MIKMLGLLFFLIAFSGYSQGEGGAFTSSRLAALKTGEGALGNNPSALNWFNDVRNKTAKLGVRQKLSLDDIEGSVYLDEAFVEGVIYYRYEPYEKFQLRYDAFNDEVEIKRSSNAQIEALHKNESISCSINHERLLFKSFFNTNGEIETGYLIELYKGDSYALYERRMKIFKEGKQAKTSLQNSFPHRFQDKVEFFIAIEEEKPKFFRRTKKEVLDLFGENNKGSIKSYFKSNKTDLKRKDDLITVFKHMDAL